MTISNQVITAGFCIEGSIWILEGRISKSVETASAKPKAGRCMNRRSGGGVGNEVREEWGQNTKDIVGNYKAFGSGSG